MFESLMFWKSKEEPSSSFSSPMNSSFNPLDVQSPPSFGDTNSGFNSGLNNGGLQTDMSGMSSMNSSAPNPYPTGFDSPTGMTQYSNGPSAGVSSVNSNDPFANPMQSSPTGFGQPAFSSANQMMQQMQSVATNPISTLPSRSVSADPNAIHPRDVELILSRLELIRAEIENVNHRLSHLEQAQLQDSSSGRGRLSSTKAKNWY